jgi:hypothetical protein
MGSFVKTSSNQKKLMQVCISLGLGQVKLCLSEPNALEPCDGPLDTFVLEQRSSRPCLESANMQSVDRTAGYRRPSLPDALHDVPFDSRPIISSTT